MRKTTKIILAVFYVLLIITIVTLSVMCNLPKDTETKYYDTPTVELYNDTGARVYSVEVDGKTYFVREDEVITHYDYDAVNNHWYFITETFTNKFNRKSTDVALHLYIGMGGK